jgi:hypothetical protein
MTIQHPEVRMTAKELTEFAASVAGVTARTWGGAAGAVAADLDGRWAAGAAPMTSSAA